MTDVTATQAARGLSDLLDAVEHRGERFTVIRRGRAIARIEPVARGTGAEVRALLERMSPDPDWARELEAVRGLLEVDDR